MDNNNKDCALHVSPSTETIPSETPQTQRSGVQWVSLDSALAPPLLDEKTLAKQLNCSISLLRKMRYKRTGPTVTRIGRLVRYAESDVAAFIAGNRGERA